MINNKKANGAAIVIVVVLLLVFGVLLYFSIGNLNQIDNDVKVISDNEQDDSFEFEDYNSLVGNHECLFDSGVDSDADGVDDLCDNCLFDYNPGQEDSDLDGEGNVCEFVGTSGFDNGDDEDECDSDLDCDDNNIYTLDICSNPEDDNSECSNEEVSCLSESDCGTDGYLYDPFCSEDNVVQTFVDYTCNNAGTDESYCSSETTEEILEMCSEDCLNGECVEDNGNGDGECVSECEVEWSQECVGDYGYLVCGDWNNDGCFEWTDYTSFCSFGESCSEGVCKNVI